MSRFFREISMAKGGILAAVFLMTMAGSAHAATPGTLADMNGALRGAIIGGAIGGVAGLLFGLTRLLFKKK
jgi:hypothetical protein